MVGKTKKRKRCKIYSLWLNICGMVMKSPQFLSTIIVGNTSE